MKKRCLSIILSIITSSFMLTGVTSFASTQEFEYPYEIISSDYYTQKVDYSLWEKFIKYDLCITDYDSLTDEEKELCRFIFDTERSADGTVRCERARRTLAGDENIGERLTLDELIDCYGVWDNYSYTKLGNSWYLHCVPDVKYLDGWDDYNEYWIDDKGKIKVFSTGENSGHNYDRTFKVEITGETDLSAYDMKEVCITSNKDGTYNVTYDINKKVPKPTFKYEIINGVETFVSNEFIEYEDDIYYIKPDNTAVFVKSKYSSDEVSSETEPVEEAVIVPDEVNNCPVVAIETSAFLGAPVTEIILPDSIEFINHFAFNGCIYLEKINFPENLKYIGNSAFCYCSSLKEIIIDLPQLHISEYAFYDCQQLTDITLNVKSIGENAFQNCRKLKNVILENSVEKISASAFHNCESIENLVLPSSVKTIGCEAFSGDTEYERKGIKSITIPSDVEIIGALPMARGEAPTSGLYIPATDPLTEEPVCVFDSDCIIYGYKGTEAETYANEWNLTFVALDSSEIMTGDANGDNEISISDAVAVSAFISNAEKNPLSLDIQTACDVHDTGNGLNASDAFKIQQYATGVIDTL